MTPESPARCGAASVLCDQWLLLHVTSFQRGIPLTMYDFWRRHAPTVVLGASKYHRYLNTRTLDDLIELVVVHGSTRLLEIFKHVGFSRYAHKQWSPFHAFVRSTIVHNLPDRLQWAFDNLRHLDTTYCNPNDLWSHALTSYQSGDLAVLKLCNALFPHDGERLSPSCLKVVDFELLQWMDQNLPEFLNQFDTSFRVYTMVPDMVIGGDLLAVMYVVTHSSRQVIGENLFRLAQKHKQFHVLAYLVEEFPGHLNSPDNHHTLQDIVNCNSDEVQQILFEHADAIRPGLFELVCRTIQEINAECLEVLQTWHANGWLAKAAPLSLDQLPFRPNSLKVIQFFHENGLATATTTTMDVAAEHGAWDIVDYLRQHRREGCSHRAIDAALKTGNLKRIRFFHEAFGVSCSSKAITFAAQEQSIDILRYLHENTNSGFSPAAMDAAASRGRLNVVKYLHKNRAEGCTTNAVDKAAKAGHIDVVQFLAENRSEGCKLLGVKQAIQNGHVEVVRLLFQHFPNLFGPQLLFGLLLRGMFDVFEKLRVLYPEYEADVVERVIVAAGEEMELPTIRYILETLDRKDLACHAVDAAARGASLEWFRVVLAMTGRDSCRLSAVRGAVATQPSRSRDDQFTFISYVIHACNDSAARDVAIAQAKSMASGDISWINQLEAEGPMGAFSPPTIHPFVEDPRTSAWAIKILMKTWHTDTDPFLRCGGPLTWAVRAAYRRDLSVLKVIWDLHSSANAGLLACERDGLDARAFSFEGAREAAIRAGDLVILRWLIENVHCVPIETTLLDEAVYYHQYEIAEWLAANHPEACTELDWTNKGQEPIYRDFGLCDGLLDWLASQDTVRNALPLQGIIAFAVRTDDGASLERLREWSR